MECSPLRLLIRSFLSNGVSDLKTIFYAVVSAIALIFHGGSLWCAFKEIDGFKRNEFFSVAVLFEVVVWGGIIMSYLTRVME